VSFKPTYRARTEEELESLEREMATLNGNVTFRNVSFGEQPEIYVEARYFIPGKVDVRPAQLHFINEVAIEEKDNKLLEIISADRNKVLIRYRGRKDISFCVYFEPEI